MRNFYWLAGQYSKRGLWPFKGDLIIQPSHNCLIMINKGTTRSMHIKNTSAAHDKFQSHTRWLSIPYRGRLWDIPIHLPHSPIMKSISKTVSIESARIDDEMQLCIKRLLLVIKYDKDMPVGMSAPQVGFNLRIIAIKDYCNNGIIRIFINPKILSESWERSISIEGCMSSSVLGERLEANRPHWIKLMAFDYFEKKSVVYTFTGLTARIIDHEIDHLDAIPWPKK